jgi:hypothetical protein
MSQLKRGNLSTWPTIQMEGKKNWGKKQPNNQITA